MKFDKFKRIIALGGAVLFTLGGLAGCGSSSADSSKESVSVEGNDVASTGEQAALNTASHLNIATQPVPGYYLFWYGSRWES